MSRKSKLISIIPSGQPVGAEITGIDIARGFDDATFQEIKDAFNETGVIVFRNQKISEQDHIAFTKRFGEIRSNKFASYHSHPKFPDEIMVVSNIKENGKYIGNPDAGQAWHTDQSYTKCPPRATILYAIKIPTRDGKPLGNTLYASAAAAYDALPDKMKKRLEGLKAIHRISARAAATRKDNHPEVRHPIVRTHPFTKRKCLYVQEGVCIGIDGMPDQEALPLIKELAQHITKPEFVYSHHWQVGDLVMWDNCTVQHRAIKDYGPDDARYIHRTLVNGTEPF